LENGLHNSYSLANNPTERDRYVTAVLREKAGKGGSAYMHDNVQVGSVLLAEGPNNNFPLSKDAKKHLLIAGGIGITPLLAMGYRLKEMGAEYYLHYCTKSPEETALMNEVMEAFAGRVTFHHDGGDASKGINLTEVLNSPEPDQHLYICGPAGLLNAARAAAAHWPGGTVHFELFNSLRTAQQIAALQNDANDGSFEIHCANSHVTAIVSPDRTILQVLRDHQIEVLYACEEGWCGNCKVKYLEGKVEHRDEYLSESERKDHMQVCISRAAPGEKRLVLDL